MKVGRHPSAQKRARQAIKRTTRNTAAVSAMKTAIKKVRAAVTAKNKETATQALKNATTVIAKTAVKGYVHKSTASRYISRLTLAVNGL